MSDPVGGYPTVWFCDSPKKEFICGICLDVLKDPQQCKNGHLFCSTCISTALESHQECPTCKTYLTIDRVSSSLLAKNLIDQMLVKCNFDQKHGFEEEADLYCKWTGPLHERAAHVSQCPVQMVRCPLYDLKKCQNCSGLVPKNGLEKHLFCLSPKENSEIVCSLVNELTTLKGKQIGNGFAVLKVGAEMYRGEVKDGLKNGFGTAKYVYDDDNLDDDDLDDIESYTGHWKDGEKCGFGTANYFDGDVYSGSWQYNQRHGKGTLKTASGKEYCGEFEHGSLHGQGIQKLADGSKYAGDFAWGDRDGQGTLTQPNGDVFNGSFSRGVQNWKGTFAYANGDLCIRSFDQALNNQRKLEMRFANGDVFIGTDCYYGEMRYADGCVSRGQFDENLSPVGVMKKFSSVDSIKPLLGMFRIV